MGTGFDPDTLYAYMNIKHKFTCFLVLFVCFENSLMPASHIALKNCAYHFIVCIWG